MSIGYNRKKDGVSYWKSDKYGNVYESRDSYSSYSRGSGYSRGYSSSRWDWGSYGGLGETLKEDEDELFIKNHDNYFTPKSYEIEAKMPYGQGYRTAANIKLVKELSRFFFHRMMEEKEYMAEEYADDSVLNENQQAEKAAKVDFYKELWDKYIPGYTPLEKAMAFFNQLSEKAKTSGSNGQPGKKFTEEMRAALDQVKFDEEIYADPDYNELLDADFFKKQNFSKVNVLNRISLIKNLGSQFKIEKDIEEKIVSHSKIIAKKMMRDYSQVFNVDLYQRLFPDFKTKLLTKNLTINVPVEKTEHKQKIIILLDFSGSMSSREKQEWVVAILMDRLRYAMKEEAEVFFSYFCYEAHEMYFHHIKDRASALKFWGTFSTMPNGGDTRIGDMVNRIKGEITIGKKLMNLDIDLSEELPEILVINDGQDSVKTNNFTYKTNAISLYQNNSQLKDLCVKNEGKYVTVGHSKEVITYSKEGMEKLII